MCSVRVDYSGLRRRTLHFGNGTRGRFRSIALGDWSPIRRTVPRARRRSGRPHSLVIAAIVLWLALSIGLPAHAADPPPAAKSPSAREVQRLVLQLDAHTRRERDQARDALLALGPPILPLLPEDRAIASAAVRQTVGEIRARLQHESALASLRPSRVTLKGTFPLREALARIAAQTGNEFDTTALDDGSLARSLAVDFESRAFWSACDEVIATADLDYGAVQKGRLQLIRTATANLPPRPIAVADQGAFRVAVTLATIRPFAISRTRFALRIAWNLRAEPRLRPLFASISGSDLQAGFRSPNAGGAQPAYTGLRPISPRAKLELSLEEGQVPLELTSDFEFPSGEARPDVEFGGSFSVEMAAGPVRFVFDDLAAANQPLQRAGSVAVRLRAAEIPAGDKPGMAQVVVSAVYNQSGPAFESYRTWMYHNEVWLEAKSKDGRRIRPGPLVATQREADGGFAVEYNFADVSGGPADYRLVYVAPTLITPTPVQFQLRNIPTARAPQPGVQP
jgi:hypothetical protein